MPAMTAPGRPIPHVQALPSRWHYVNRARDHHIAVEYYQLEGRMRIIESSSAGETCEQHVPASKPWEARLALWMLEGRLSHLGEYWRSRPGAQGWTPVARPVGTPTPDARPNEFLTGAHHIHHYHDETKATDQILAALPTEDPTRYTIVRANVEGNNLELGRIDILHAALPESLTRSLIMREQIALSQAGVPKLVNADDYQRAFGYLATTRAPELIDHLAGRVRDGKLNRPAPKLEDSDVYAEFLITINDPRLVELHNRYLKPGEEEKILAEGPPAVRRFITNRRATVAHHERHLLSLLEASLLAREKMNKGTLVRSDPEVRALTRLAFYL